MLVSCYPHTVQMLEQAYVDNSVSVSMGTRDYLKELTTMMLDDDVDSEIDFLNTELREIQLAEAMPWGDFLKLSPLGLAALINVPMSHLHEVNAKNTGIM